MPYTYCRKILKVFASLCFVSLIAHSSAAETSVKQKVAGIGGMFFRAEDPPALAKWYDEHLGISPVPTTYEAQPWQQEAGATVFAPFNKNTEYFGDKAKSWMINFRVHDLDAMVKQLKTAGIAVEVDPETYPNGRFARLTDPEGNPIQLWQPIIGQE